VSDDDFETTDLEWLAIHDAYLKWTRGFTEQDQARLNELRGLTYHRSRRLLKRGDAQLVSMDDRMRALFLDLHPALRTAPWIPGWIGDAKRLVL